ncbi:class F sortase [Candidatus Viridilinea mediisalina]|uniref:Sortase n=1 Tax=Candidatus Viridilinea mediisalina TaxID=2024553 RepID=A0A2A6REA2_9CHLR|nr:class F sortase [Candidatus Viridilinea mediisalina]PDW00961.1 hypothetical protein CJ255_19960 [Candidatus Viridilinea mediisalina]
MLKRILNFSLLLLLLGGCGGTTSPQEQAVVVPTTVAPAPTAAPLATAVVLSAESVALIDQPLLEQPTAVPQQPTALPPSTTSEVGRPVRLVIDALELDREVLAVGLDEQRMPVVLDHDVAWYRYSATPGQGENIVLWGHVLRFRNTPDIPAPFARLHQLSPGDPITLYDDQGRSTTYRVTQQIQALPDQIEYMLPKGREQLTLITCIGDLVIDEAGVNMSHRLITLAEPE